MSTERPKLSQTERGRFGAIPSAPCFRDYAKRVR